MRVYLTLFNRLSVNVCFFHFAFLVFLSKNSISDEYDFVRENKKQMLESFNNIRVLYSNESIFLPCADAEKIICPN